MKTISYRIKLLFFMIIYKRLCWIIRKEGNILLQLYWMSYADKCKEDLREKTLWDILVKLSFFPQWLEKETEKARKKRELLDYMERMVLQMQKTGTLNPNSDRIDILMALKKHFTQEEVNTFMQYHELFFSYAATLKELNKGG